MTTKKKSKSKKKVAKKKSATDRVVELVLQNPKATLDELAEALKKDGFDKTAPATIQAQTHHTKKVAKILAGMDMILVEDVIARFRE
ncbi:MAG: hypothetical protein IH994_02475 [Proteobacteria bacterium]|nr:hypothetical protein [Pseudomonadota bacterium]